MPSFFNGKIIFIHIPKCAGKSVRSALMNYQINKRPDLQDNIELYRWHESLIELQQVHGNDINNSCIISTIRHPAERAVSWWKYLKKANTQSYLANNKFDMLASEKPLLSPIDVKNYHGRPLSCKHRINQTEVEKFNSLSFEEYLEKTTMWKIDGCPEPYCPYHQLSPQVAWLCGPDGNIRMNKLNLFLVERLSELQEFLPDFGHIENKIAAFESDKQEGHIKDLTTKSLITLKRLYTQDFQLYDILKSRPSNYYELFDENKIKRNSFATLNFG